MAQSGVTLPQTEWSHGEAERIGDHPGNDRIELTVVLRRRDHEGLRSRLEAIRQALPGGRPHVDYGELAAAHGADADALSRLTALAGEHGLTVGEHNAVGPAVRVAGTASDISAAFGVRLGTYRMERDNTSITYRGYDGALALPADLADGVVGVLGLDARPIATAKFIVSGPAAAGQGNSALQVAQAYGVPSVATALGQRVAIVELGGGYADSDVSSYAQQLGIAAPAVSAVSVDGATNSPSPGGPSPNSADGEVALDIDVIAAVAQQAAIAVYFAPNTEQGFVDAVSQAAKDGCAAISVSWGAPEADWSQQGLNSLDQACQGALALGIPVFCAAGDSGSSDGINDGKSHADFPASSPHAVGCGGTSLPNLSASGETAWNDLANGGGAGGGAVSDVWPLPSFQHNVSTPPSVNDGQRRRTVPDISGDAQPATGYRVFVGGRWYVLGGTSAVAPLISAMHTLLDAAVGAAKSGQRLGDFNSLLYGTWAPNGAVHDIADGSSNGQYTATRGYDAVTGWGSPEFSRWRQLLNV